MRFTTQRLVIKPFEDSSKGKMIEMLYDESIKKTYMIPDFDSAEDAEKLFFAFARLSRATDRYVGGIYLDDELIGFMNDTEIEGERIELGYTISPKYQNMGYCTEALSGAIFYLFENGFSEVICGAFEENLASIRVMQKCGMNLLDKTDLIDYRGKTHKCIYYAFKKISD